MTTPVTGTLRLHRVFKAPAERLYRAFSDPRAMCKWLSPNGFVSEVQHMDFRVGGTFHMSFTNFCTGQTHGFGGKYIDLVPHKSMKYTDVFDDKNLPGEMLVTVNFNAVQCGTELVVVQEGIPAMIPVEMCTLGWQESLALLKLLVEAEIP